MKMVQRVLSIAAIAACALSMSYASTYFVNASTGNDANNGTASGTAFKTITHALSVATNTDVINVAAGTYNKTLGETFPLTMVSGVTLTGTAGALTTIINASDINNNRVFDCISNSASTIIQGFTITDGYVRDTSSAGVVSKGGGMYIDGGSPIIQNNIITNNTSRGYDFYQAGIGANNGGTGNGGGIYIANGGAPTIRNNVISYNIAQGGGGKDYRGGWSGNGSAGGNATGGGIYASGAEIIINNTIYGNQAIGGLGGSSNSLSAGDGGNATAGGIAASFDAIIKNNIFSNNSAIGGTVGGGSGGSNGTATDGALSYFQGVNFSYNLYYNNTATTNPDGGNLGTNNIMGSDPLFVSATNFHFTSTSSPAYHAGTPTGAPTTDLDGTTRSVTTPSIGAYEGTDPLPVELVSFTVSTNGSSVVLSWGTATEVNNYGFEVERGSIQNSESRIQNGNAEWTKMGFVEGAGTTNAPKEYSFNDKNLAAGRYQYRLKQIDRDGMFKYSQSIEAEVGAAPKAFGLSQNYPNPFNPSTTIEYSIVSSGIVSVRVYDVLGREVASLVNERQEAGTYSVRLDASKLSSGFYYYTLSAGTSVSTRKMLLLK